MIIKYSCIFLYHRTVDGTAGNFCRRRPISSGVGNRKHDIIKPAEYLQLKLTIVVWNSNI